ncbi:MAG TPA: GNAT family N-acetyltransferase [Candidatus Aminicenantes bacterium]|jgi:ribosomal protein S18 acetylase RimI-like enzyme|nr:GNAT family N-acetyltransferase [Candidatus Aminicenantes bacterium]HPB56567.1 GNAT family N-acetyltransferase [Candidatus Aminicenantes bacterium]HPT00862.1 GNAT family N-acetyltransferase [Candidatus Aminicenantes bacterium]
MENDKEKPLRKRTGIEIRSMTIDDLAPVFHLGERLFTAQTFPTLYRTWDQYEVVSLFQEDSDFCFVAEGEEGELLGFVMGTTIEKSRSPWSYGYLVWLGTDPEAQTQGVATRLFHAFHDRMEEEGVRMLIVDTEADNHPALKFFDKMGFGSPREHIYLSLNLDTERRVLKENLKRSKDE